MYVKRSHERALDCCDSIYKETLFGVCLYEIQEKYREDLKNLTFTFYAQLIEAVRRTNESVKKVMKYSLMM